MALDGASLEDRKRKEIEHSRQRRSILQGYERFCDTHHDEEVKNIKHLVRDEKEFKRHFSNVKFYSVTTSSEGYVQDWLRSRCPGKRALDYCCGNGEFAVFMAKCGAQAVGVDISPEGIANAKENACMEGVQDNCSFVVMDGEAMDFPDHSFDVIVEWGALHHLDLDKAMKELRRVLKPGGEIICVEALRHNPIIHLYRKLTMHLRTQWEVEHILGVDQIESCRRYFSTLDIRFFHLLALAAVPFRKTKLFKPLRNLLYRLDERILSMRPLAKYAWIAVFTLRNPRT